MNTTARIFVVAAAFAAAAGAAAEPGGDWREPAALEDVRAELVRGRTAPAASPNTTPGADAPSAIQKLIDMKRPALEALYRESPPGPIPDGESNGVAAVGPGTPEGRITEALFSVFWHGKVFDRARGELVNRILFGRIVKAKVFLGPSWLDGKPSVIIDYRGQSWIAGAIRDEIRLVAPGVYLGFAYVRSPNGGAPRADIVFALDFNRN